jgi:hypothetical protein
MKRTIAILLLICGVFVVKVQGQEAAPLKLVQTYKLPADVKGNFDHFAIDLAGNRLFATPEAYKAVLVFDLKTGNIIHKISGIEKPHAILYREDLKRLYVTDGEAGDVKIVDSESYKIVSSVKLLEDADSIGYDPSHQASLYRQRRRRRSPNLFDAERGGHHGRQESDRH